MPKYAKTRTIDGKEAVSKSLDGKKYWQKPTLLTESGNGLVEMDDAVGNYDGAVNSAKFYGKTLKMCQFASTENAISSTTGGVTFTKKENNGFSIHGTCNNGNRVEKSLANLTNVVNGHKYFVVLNGLKNSVRNEVFPYVYQDGVMGGIVSVGGTVFTATGDGTPSLLFYVYDGFTVDEEVTIQSYDLTAMEQELISDYASFHALYNKDYYPHGEYLVSNDSVWKATGKNLLNTSEYVFDGTPMELVIFDEEVPYGDYTFSIEEGDDFESIQGSAALLEFNGKYVAADLTLKKYEFVCHGINRFKLTLLNWSASTGSCVFMLEKGNTHTDYEPYHNGGTVDNSLLVQTVTGTSTVVKGALQAGTARDEHDAITGKWGHKVGAVDLGSLDYAKDDTYAIRFNAELLDAKIVAFDALGNILCAVYPTVTALQTAQGVDGIAISNDGYIYIRDASKENLSAVQFKNAVQGFLLFYELAEPWEETVTPQPITLQKGYNSLRQIDGSLANTGAEAKYYEVESLT